MLVRGYCRGKTVADEGESVEEASRKDYPRESGGSENDGGRHGDYGIGGERRGEGESWKRVSEIALRPV